MEFEKAIIISDIHLCSNVCQAELVLKFIKQIKESDTNLLLINGDLFEHMEARMKKDHWKILSSLRKLSDEKKVVWCQGNHDYPAGDMIANLLGIEFCEEYVFYSGGKKVLCIHGDKWDGFDIRHPIITSIADWFYRLIQRLDPSHNYARLVKKQSKTFLRCMTKIKQGAYSYAEELKADIVCCGHSHCAEMWGGTKEQPIIYANGGSWCEYPCTFLEINSGKIQLNSAK